MNNLEIEQRLWEYIDGLSTGEERTTVERLIQENKQWRDTHQELLQVHQMLESTELEQPSLRFTKNVMEELARHHIAPATKAYINTKIIWGIAGFFVLSIVGCLIYGLGQIDWTLSDDTTNALGVDFSKVEYGRLFNNTVMNIFMMLNAVLGLMLLDRYISNKRPMSPKGKH
jgi:hypothetical protein